jgi:hypothetical protein
VENCVTTWVDRSCKRSKTAFIYEGFTHRPENKRNGLRGFSTPPSAMKINDWGKLNNLHWQFCVQFDQGHFLFAPVLKSQAGKMRHFPA